LACAALRTQWQRRSWDDSAVAGATRRDCAEHQAEEIVYWFEQVKSYYDEAAKSGEAMLPWID
jgi:hypothetical protein